jgi:hypothetical protein
LGIKFWEKIEESNKSQVKYFYCKDSETPEQFENRINEFFETLENYSIEFDAFNEGSGLYFIRYVIHNKQTYHLRWKYIFGKLKIIKKKET